MSNNRTIVFKTEWLSIARTLNHENACGLFLEAIIDYASTKKWPYRLENLEAMGAFKAIVQEIRDLNFPEQ